MQYVYVLQSMKDHNLYVGCTKDLKLRLKLHNTKKVSSTAKRTPFVLIYYEAYLNSRDAYSREIFMKTQYGRNYIKRVMANFLLVKI